MGGGRDSFDRNRASRNRLGKIVAPILTKTDIFLMYAECLVGSIIIFYAEVVLPAFGVLTLVGCGVPTALNTLVRGINAISNLQRRESIVLLVVLQEITADGLQFFGTFTKGDYGVTYSFTRDDYEISFSTPC